MNYTESVTNFSLFGGSSSSTLRKKWRPEGKMLVCTSFSVPMSVVLVSVRGVFSYR